MKALVIGSGGREHALAWKLSRSQSVDKIYATPGNPGIEEIATCIPGSDYLAIAKELDIDLTVVGPEAPLVDGVVDRFRAAGKLIVGPNAACARLEGSKVYSKQFMTEYRIPTARFAKADDRQSAVRQLDSFEYPVVIKADGLAAGKGVVIAANRAEAMAAITSLQFPVVMEEFLEGDEISFIVLCDGKTGVPLAPSQDHKRAFDGDQGPNTGGMGAYSDSAILSDTDREEVLQRIIQPVIEATGFTGFLYAGLMMTKDGPKVLEFNVRLGDPETQPLMMRLESDFGEVLQAAAVGTLGSQSLRWSPDPATCVVLASEGYPGPPKTGVPIFGLNDVKEAIVFHAGTKRSGNQIVTGGGRILGVTARGADLPASIAKVYRAVEKIHFPGMQYRNDIGAKAIRRYNGKGAGT